MHPVWHFLLIITMIAVSGIFGGLEIRKYFENDEDKDSVRFLIRGGLLILAGIIVSVSTFFVFAPSGRTSVETTPDGAYQQNLEAPPEPTKDELQEDSKKKKDEEWGEVNTKSHEEIRDESNKMINEAIRRNQ